jgi:hypothetical protein
MHAYMHTYMHTYIQRKRKALIRKGEEFLHSSVRVKQETFQKWMWGVEYIGYFREGRLLATDNVKR